MKIKYILATISVLLLWFRLFNQLVGPNLYSTNWYKNSLLWITSGGTIIIVAFIVWGGLTERSLRARIIHYCEECLLLLAFLVLVINVITWNGWGFKVYFGFGFIYTISRFLRDFIKAPSEKRKKGEWALYCFIPALYPILYWIDLKDKKI